MHPSGSCKSAKRWPSSGKKRAPPVGRTRRAHRRGASAPVPASRTRAATPRWAEQQAEDFEWGDELRASFSLRLLCLVLAGDFHAYSAVAEEAAGGVEHGLAADAKPLA